VRSCLIDGEAVVCDDDGRAVLERLRKVRRSGGRIFFFHLTLRYRDMIKFRLIVEGFGVINRFILAKSERSCHRQTRIFLVPTTPTSPLGDSVNGFAFYPHLMLQ
jgi:hypothetical protein